tara:strand:- start:334 stop:861 length:528 start_codon:yes stop_codon:yes gene_type:complete
MKLFAVFLGGRADKCNIELHDVVFTCAKNIESSYTDLLAKWFGNPKRLHIDSWVELKYIDGYKIDLFKSKSNQNEKLYFINLGGYDKYKFEELHESKFLIGENKINIKKRAKDSLLLGYDEVHTDDLYDVDDCIEIKKVSDFYIHLSKTNVPQKLNFNNGYHPIPKKVILEFINN